MALRLPGRHDAYLYPKTMFGPALVYTVEGDDGRAVRLLRVGRSVQSATYVDEDSYAEPVFDYYLAFDLMFEANPHIRNVLMLGGGGYAYPKHLIATHPDTRIDVVEIDPAITRIAREHFFLDKLIEEHGLARAGSGLRAGADGAGAGAGAGGAGDAHTGACASGGAWGSGGTCPDSAASPAGRLGLICDDGARYLRERARDGVFAPYDAIVFDTFAGRRPVEALASHEAICDARACLAPAGVLVANVVAALEGPGSAFLDGYLERLGREFTHVQAVPLSPDAGAQADNVIVIASDEALGL